MEHMSVLLKMERTSVLKFVVAFLALQVVFAITLEQAVQRMEKLLEESTKTSAKAVEDLEQISQQVRVLADRVLGVGEVQLDNEIDRMVTELQDVIISADHMGINITSCTQGRVGVVHEIHYLAKLEMVTCVDRFTQQATIAVTKGLGGINVVLAEVTALYNKLSQCKANEQSCIDTVVAQIDFQEVDVPRQIQEQLDTSGNKAEVNRLLLGECGFRESENVVRRAGAIIAEVQKCFDILVSGSSSPRPLEFEQM